MIAKTWCSKRDEAMMVRQGLACMLLFASVACGSFTSALVESDASAPLSETIAPRDAGADASSSLLDADIADGSDSGDVFQCEVQYHDDGLGDRYPSCFIFNADADIGSSYAYAMYACRTYVLVHMNENLFCVMNPPSACRQDDTILGTVPKDAGDVTPKTYGLWAFDGPARGHAVAFPSGQTRCPSTNDPTFD